jgi:hypothetical protein
VGCADAGLSSNGVDGSSSALLVGYVAIHVQLSDKGKRIMEVNGASFVVRGCPAVALRTILKLIFAGDLVQMKVLRFGPLVVSFVDSFVDGSSRSGSSSGLGRMSVLGGDLIADGNLLGLGGLEIEMVIDLLDSFVDEIICNPPNSSDWAMVGKGKGFCWIDSGSVGV